MPSDPFYIIRSHRAQLGALCFSFDNERLYSGDSDGLVCITSTQTLRPLARWNAHSDGILGIQEWHNQIITHGRDNKLHIWTRILAPQTVADVANPPDLPIPSIKYSLDVNALNYCRFSLLPLHPSPRALIALPNLVESSFVDIWSLPDCKRIHAAIGSLGEGVNPSREKPQTGIVMSIHLYAIPSPTTGNRTQLRVLTSYENGSVTLHASDSETSIEGRTWDVLWSHKLHAETVMGVVVSRDNTMALSISADHIVGQYFLTDDKEPRTITNRIKQPGNGAIAMRDDGKVCVVGGWDGKIRLFSTKSFKPLGTLRYHKEGCFALSFAHSSSLPFIPTVSQEKTYFPSSNRTEGVISPQGIPNAVEELSAPPLDDEDARIGESLGDEMDQEERMERERWLVSSGKDQRIAIWKLISF